MPVPSGGDATYDEVGHAAPRGPSESGAALASGITAAHVSLPLESYAEVTALATGRTILVRIDQRSAAGGPMMILSPEAAAQLGLAGVAPIRIRRVNPSAPEQAVLRAGGRAPARLDAPPALLAALRKRLPDVATGPERRQAPDEKTWPGRTEPKAPPVTARVDAAAPAAPILKLGRYVIQVAAFSTEARALTLARELDGHVATGGGFWRVRLGPYAHQGDAQTATRSLAGKGFKNARIMAIDAR
ncbi:MAG: SPOR domain-containing protein [Sphingobium sp.]